MIIIYIDIRIYFNITKEKPVLRKIRFRQSNSSCRAETLLSRGTRKCQVFLNGYTSPKFPPPKKNLKHDGLAWLKDFCDFSPCLRENHLSIAFRWPEWSHLLSRLMQPLPSCGCSLFFCVFIHEDSLVSPSGVSRALVLLAYPLEKRVEHIRR